MKKDACKMCGKRTDLELHHIIPKVNGGTDDETNLVCLCSSCHYKLHLMNRSELIKDGVEKHKYEDPMHPRHRTGSDFVLRTKLTLFHKIATEIEESGAWTGSEIIDIVMDAFDSVHSPYDLIHYLDTDKYVKRYCKAV